MTSMWKKILGVSAVAIVGYYAFTRYQKKKTIAAIASPDTSKEKGKVQTPIASGVGGGVKPIVVGDLNLSGIGKSGYCTSCPG